MKAGLILALLLAFVGGPLHAQSFSPQDGQAAARLRLDARLTEDGDAIGSGLVWRVFGDRPQEDGTYPLIATARGGTADLELPSGRYLVHVAFGRAGATTRVDVGADGARQTMVLDAGGLELDATSAGQPIRDGLLRFSIYELEADLAGERRLIALNVRPGEVLRLNAGTYHVLSRFGTINATVRADLQVKAGRLTKATLQHRGAEVSLRLVSQPGGDAIANTSWTVLTQDGQQVFASSLVSPSLVLAEGTYEVVARNGEKVHRLNFKVSPGLTQRVEVPISG